MNVLCIHFCHDLFWVCASVLRNLKKQNPSKFDVIVTFHINKDIIQFCILMNRLHLKAYFLYNRGKKGDNFQSALKNELVIPYFFAAGG